MPSNWGLAARVVLGGSVGITIIFGSGRSTGARAIGQPRGPLRMHESQVAVRDWSRLCGATCAVIPPPQRQAHGTITSRCLPAVVRISIYYATTVDRPHCLFRLFSTPIVGGLVDIRSISRPTMTRAQSRQISLSPSMGTM